MGVYIPFANRLPSSCDFCYISLSGCKARNPYVDGRPTDCPLVEVKPHGRLIDADAISEDDRQVYGFYNSYDLQQLLDAAPTIIEAEGEDDRN